METNSSSNFILDIIDADIAAGRTDHVHTRFPPEPNGYLHIGSAKAIYINYTTAKKYGGKFNLRFDDTNPERESDEYVRSIKEDLHWLGADPDAIFFGSDYFEKCYEFAVQLIKDGKAYVCDLSQAQMSEYRGTLTEPGRESPWRNRTIEENLDLFEHMKAGEFPDGSRTLRAKMDMASPNILMRDPAIYRIKHANHHRQGDKWCIYPLYDYAHPIQDALEGITHSLCSLEFENHRPLYDWVVENIGFNPRPHQYEFARLGVTYTVMSKRYLRRLVEEGRVDGWDDPRMPTLCGLRRRGYTPGAIFEFVRRAGIAKTVSLLDVEMLEYCLRNELNAVAARRVCVTEPLRVTITNYPEGKEEFFDLPNNPQSEDAGTRPVRFSRELYVERSDFEEVPPPKFHRLMPGGEVRLMGAYIIRVNELEKDENGNVTRLLCTADLESGNGNPTDGRKIKGTVHWLDAATAADAEIMYCDRLFNVKNVAEAGEEELFSNLNPDSARVVTGAKVEPALASAAPGEHFQFVRTGYFTPDIKNPGRFICSVGLKDSYKPAEG